MTNLMSRSVHMSAQLYSHWYCHITMALNCHQRWLKREMLLSSRLLWACKYQTGVPCSHRCFSMTQKLVSVLIQKLVSVLIKVLAMILRGRDFLSSKQLTATSAMLVWQQQKFIHRQWAPCLKCSTFAGYSIYEVKALNASLKLDWWL